jgi:hypothetical protein
MSQSMHDFDDDELPFKSKSKWEKLNLKYLFGSDLDISTCND